MTQPRRESLRRSRADCLELLATVLAHGPGGVRGTAVFLLDCDRPRGHGAHPDGGLCERVQHEVARRLGAAAPTWHRLLIGERGEFIVIAQSLVDGNAVLGSAARLVHAYDDALQVADLPLAAEVSIGIAFTPQHGATAEGLLSAAEASLREAIAAARNGARSAGGDGPEAAGPSVR